MSKLWQKATAAARSAHALFEDGDLDGAANRAYYAMFSAARGLKLAAISTSPEFGSTRLCYGCSRSTPSKSELSTRG